MASVIIFSKDGCERCEKAKAWAARHHGEDFEVRSSEVIEDGSMGDGPVARRILRLFLARSKMVPFVTVNDEPLPYSYDFEQ